MTSSSHPFALLDPAALPSENIVIDVWILRNQSVILTTLYNTNTGANWKFNIFIQNMKTEFNQDIVISTQQYNHVLV